MGTRSPLNWSDTIIDGVVLGHPAVDETTGQMEWDGGIPSGVLDEVGLFHPDSLDDNGDPAEPYDLEVVHNVKYKTPEDGDVYHKDDVLEVDDTLYACKKQETTLLPPSDDWKIVKDKKDKAPKPTRKRKKK